ncbi:hypothetical protein MHB81_05195 [Paenibacillus sp. FSL H7-0326]
MKKLSDELFTWKWIIFIIVVFGLGWITRDNMIQEALANQLSMNKWDVFLSILMQSRFIVYFLIPFWILFNVLVIIRSWDTSILIRLKNYKNWILYVAAQVLPMVIILHVLWIIVAIILTLDLPYSSEWSNYSNTEIAYNSLIHYIQETAYSPWTVMSIHVVFFFLALLFISMLFALFFVLIPKLLAIAIFAFIFLCYFIVSYRVFPLDSIFTYFNYMTFYSVYQTFQPYWIGWVCLLLILIITLRFIDSIKKLSSKAFLGVLNRRKSELIYVLLCLIGFVSPLLDMGASLTTVWDLWYLRLLGFSGDGFNMLILIFYFIIYLGFIYLVQLYLNDYLTGRFYYTVIRYKSLNKWFIAFMKRISILIIVFLSGLFVLAISIGMIQGLSLEPRVSIEKGISLLQLLFHFFINGFLQMINYILTVFILIWLIKDHGYHMITMMVLIIAGWGSSFVQQMIPAGLNSFGYMTNVFSDMLFISFVLVVGIIVQICIIKFLFYKRGIAFY